VMQRMTLWIGNKNLVFLSESVSCMLLYYFQAYCLFFMFFTIQLYVLIFQFVTSGNVFHSSPRASLQEVSYQPID
jgi:hypothetical protein